MNVLEMIGFYFFEKLKTNLGYFYNNRAKTHFRKNDFDKAIANFTKAIELNLQDVEAYYTRGKLYDEDGKYDKAIADFTEAIKLDPEHADAWGFRATLYNERGEYDKAIEGCSKDRTYAQLYKMASFAGDKGG